VRVNAIAITELMIGLQDGCHSMPELAELSGLAIQTVRLYCNTMHRKGIVHIADWTEDSNGGRTLKVFALGSGKDMPKPKRRSGAEVCARYRSKQKHLTMVQRMAA
jgi:hypothetical protein